MASCKAVSNSTAQLLLACRAKADPNSKTQKGLQVNDDSSLDYNRMFITFNSFNFIVCTKGRICFVINLPVLFQAAGQAVKRAADALAKAAQGSEFFKEEYDEVHITIGGSTEYDEELEMQELILRKQRELENARVKLKIIKEGRFRDDEGGEEGEEQQQ